MNLGLNYRGVEIRWFGKRDMSWYDFAATVEKEIKLLPPPSYLIIQLGSNDLGKGKSCGLIIDIESTCSKFERKWNDDTALNILLNDGRNEIDAE